MASVSRIPILAFLLVAGTTNCVTTLRAEDVLEAHWKAVGGKKAITKIKTVHRSGTLEGTASSAPVTGRYEEAANFPEHVGYSSMMLSFSGYAFDRKTGWTKQSAWSSDPQSGVQAIPKAEVEFTVLQSAPSPLLAMAMREPPSSVKLTGERDFNGKTCDVFQVTGFGGEFFVNQTTHLLEGIFIAGYVEVKLSDYRTVDGVQFPGKQTLKLPAQDITFDFTFTEIDLNKPVDVSKCERPASHVTSNQKPSPSPPASQKLTAKSLIGYLDKDGDNKIDEKEYILAHPKDPKAKTKATFKMLDTDKDGWIDTAEAEVMAEYANKQQPGGDGAKPSGGSQVIRMMDKDNDGKISKSEAPEDLRLFFSDYDTDDDGLIDTNEAAAIAKYLSPSPSAKNTPTSNSSVTAKQLIAYMDKNGDDKISKDEGGKELADNFHYLDTDGDGFIDVKEAKVMAEYVNKAK